MNKLQITSNAATVYEDFFVPAIFREWAERVMNAAKIKESDNVLDVACGTGILARTIEQHLKKPLGNVVGIDLNEVMLQVAAQKAPGIEWKPGSAEALPFEDEKFDAVVSQFGLMFFTDRHKALQEMMRVLKPQGNLAIAVWDSLENSPGYKALSRLVQRHLGNVVAEQLHFPFVLGDRQQLLQLFKDAGISEPTLNTVKGKARFPSIKSWIFTDMKGWTMSEMINDQQLEELLDLAENELRSFISPDGTISFDMPAHIVTAVKK